MGMRLWKKIVLTLLIALVLLVAGLAAVFFFWLGPTAKALVESIGPKALGTHVEIESLSINPRKGTLDLQGFQIGTHEGFSHTNTWELAGLHIAIDVRSLFSDTIVIHAIEVESPHFTYEQNEATDNISEFIRNIQAFAKIDPDQPKEKKPKKPKKEGDAEKPPKKVVVEWLRINDMQMHLANTDRPELDIQLGMEQFSLCLTNGLIQLDHLVLSDPGLLSTPNVAEIEAIKLRLDSDSIYSGSLVIEDVQITKPYAYFEQNAETDTLAAFMEVAKTFAADTVSAPPAKEKGSPKPQTRADKKAAPPIVLHNLAIDDIRLHLVNTADPKLNIAIKLEKLGINPAEGFLKLRNLAIGNPGRLATTNLFELESIDIKVDPASLFSGTVVVEDVQVAKPYAFLEQNPETDTVSEFMKIADRFATKTDTATNAPPPETKPREPETVAEAELPPVPFELRNLEIDDIRLNLLDSTGTNGPSTLRTMAAIGRIAIKLGEGKLQVEGITVPNPPGFAGTNLFHLANIRVSIDPGSIFSDQVVVKEIFLDSPKVQLEQTETAGNLGELLGTIDGFKPKTGENEPTPAPDPGKTKEAIPLAEQPVVLDTLLVTNFLVHITAPTPTNMPRDGLVGKMDIRGKMRLGERLHLDQINPMKDPESEVPPVETTSIDLLAFGLLSIEPLKGLVEVSNLEVGNPEGFANKNLIQLEVYRMDFNPDSIQSNIFLIEDILIDKPKIAYERKLSTDNIKALQELIESVLRRKETAYATPPEPELMGPPKPGSIPEETSEPTGKKVVIEHLELSEGVVRAKISKLPTIPVIPLRLEMNDLGKEEGGTSIQDAFGKIFGAFYDAIIGVVGNASGLAGDTLKGAGNLTLDGLGTLTGGLIGTDKKDEAEEQE